MAEDTEELKRNIEQTRRNLGQDVDALTDKVSPSQLVGRRVERARGGMSRLKDHVMGSAESVRDSAGSATSSVQDAGTKVGEMVGSAPDRARAQTRGTPLAAGLVAFAAGWIVAAALPPSVKEREVAHDAKDKAMEVAEPLKEEAAHAAQEVKDNLQQPAQEAVEHIRQSASDAASDVVEQGRGAAQDVADQSKDSADAVRQAGSPGS
jgi:gas vesicle protein